MSHDDEQISTSGLVLYRTEYAKTRIDVRLEGGIVWLTQAQMAELFQTSAPNINLHLKAIYEERELAEAATIKDYLIVRQEGRRRVSRKVQIQQRQAAEAAGEDEMLKALEANLTEHKSRAKTQNKSKVQNKTKNHNKKPGNKHP